MNKALKVLLLEDDPTFAGALSRNFNKRGHSVHHVVDLKSLAEIPSTEAFDLILLDLKLENETSIAAIAPLRDTFPNSKIFMITAFASIATTVEAIKQGADDYLPKPLTSADILTAYFSDDKSSDIADEVFSPKRLEWEHIQRVLANNNGNVSQTAKQLNMHRRTLQRKLQKKPGF